ncbi:hypothetical protein ACVIW2_000454 [Bradyrhizobium huanghuaihaiense]
MIQVMTVMRAWRGATSAAKLASSVPPVPVGAATSTTGGGRARPSRAKLASIRVEHGFGFLLPSPALQPARRFRQRPAPPQQHDDRHRGDHQHDAPAVVIRRHDEVTEQRGGDEAEGEEAGERAGEAAAVTPRHELREIGRDDRALRAGAHAGDDARGEEGRPCVDHRADDGGRAIERQRRHHHRTAADEVAQRTRQQRAEQEADIGAAAEHADLHARQIPRRAQHRQDEGQHRRVHRVEHVAEPAHQQQMRVEACERKALDARRYHRHESPPLMSRARRAAREGTIDKVTLSS